VVATALKSGLQRWRDRQTDLPGLPPSFVTSLLPIAVLAIGITALVIMLLWRDQAGYKPVFGAREKVAAADMMAVLDAEKVPYRLHPDSGQVLVPDDQLGKVRMLLAAKGVTAKLPAGLELMDRNDPLGVSQFVQDVRFRRGLEGELAQSILTLDAVDSARVHLSIAKSSSFVVSDGEKSSASVVMALKPGRKLGNEQIAAIINLVAGSVASLDPQRVSLVDQAGNLLSAHVDLSEGSQGIQAAGNEASARFQAEATRNVHELLAPVLGADNFKTSVTAEVDNDRIEETREQYGETPKVTTEATREEQDRDAIALGVPGSLSNRPVAVAASGPAPGGTARKNATTRQYAYDRQITQIKRSRGRLAKLSVAVVLNNTGRAAAWTAAEVKQIDTLLRNGLGIDAARGDQLVVSALAFPVRPPAAPWWHERDTVIDIGTNVFYLLGAIAGFFLIVRPLMQLLRQRVAGPAKTALAQLTPLSPTQAPGSAGGSMPASGETRVTAATQGAPDGPALALPPAPAATANVAPVVPLMENYDLPPPGSPVDVMVDHLKVLAGKEPERVAEVVKQWVQKHGRTE
jgi:flagellar M-ring protein FliF